MYAHDDSDISMHVLHICDGVRAVVCCYCVVHVKDQRLAVVQRYFAEKEHITNRLKNNELRVFVCFSAGKNYFGCQKAHRVSSAPKRQCLSF